MTKIIFEFENISIEAELNDSPTSKDLINLLPLEGISQIWGEEIFFSTNLQVKLEDDARDVMQLGELAFWTEGSAIAIGYGKTPVSIGQEIRLIGPCNVWADCSFKKSDFDNIKSGDQISLDWK